MYNFPHVIKLHEMGLSLFPCEPGEKVGALLAPEKPWRIKWYEHATDNLTTLAKMWRHQPRYNIGVSCKKSGILVVDCDIPKDDGEEDGFEQYQRLIKAYGQDVNKAVDTYTVETPSGGLHFYYWWPPLIQASQTSPDSLLDVRTNAGEKGGYVLGAGSITPLGMYMDNGATIKVAPSWMVAAFEKRPPPTVDSSRFTGPRSPGGLLRWLEDAQPGEQDERLNRVVYALKNEGLSEEDVRNSVWPIMDSWPTSGSAWTEADLERHIRGKFR